MRVVVDFQDEDLEFEVPSERVVASWRGPEGLGPDEALAAVRDALENPRDFPPLRQMIVPGDRVAIALDPSIPRSPAVVDGLVEVLLEAGAQEESLAIVAPRPVPDAIERTNPAGSAVVHDPDDRTGIAYLASTREGRRVYLNRAVTDADVVIPVGRLGYDPDLGFRGPWSTLFPGLSDRKTMKEMRDRNGGGSGDGDLQRFQTRLDESFEVSWLLGTQFFLGVVPGRKGPLEVIAGRDAEVRERGIASLEENWTFRAPSRAEMVIAGVGSPGCNRHARGSRRRARDRDPAGAARGEDRRRLARRRDDRPGPPADARRRRPPGSRRRRSAATRTTTTTRSPNGSPGPRPGPISSSPVRSTPRSSRTCRSSRWNTPSRRADWPRAAVQSRSSARPI